MEIESNQKPHSDLLLLSKEPSQSGLTVRNFIQNASTKSRSYPNFLAEKALSKFKGHFHPKLPKNLQVFAK